MFTNDYIMRQIELLGLGAAKILKKEVKKDDFVMEVRPSGDVDSLAHRLYDLVEDGKLCEAEDILFVYAEENPTSEVFAVAVEFYNLLSEMSDEQLLRYDFPREDIAKGLSALITLISD